MTHVVLYGKAGCHLCDEARDVVAAVRGLGVPVWVPPVELCTDNAAMIAGAARFGRALAYPEYLDLDAAARL